MGEVSTAFSFGKSRAVPVGAAAAKETLLLRAALNGACRRTAVPEGIIENRVRNKQMATPPLHFDNAPIREAIIAIQIHDLPDSIVEELNKLPQDVKDAYPKSTPISMSRFVGEISPQKTAASAHQQPLGLQFNSSDSKQLFQARLNGFSFHRLAPYESWKPFRDEAFKLWGLYRKVVGPVKIVNFSVRYVNTLVVPAPGLLEDYLRVYPQLSPEIPQMLNNYYMRLDLPLENEGAGDGILTMTQTLLRSEPGTSSILLDNLFMYAALDVPDDTLWKRIDAVQAVKNRVFLATLTPEMQKRIA